MNPLSLSTYDYTLPDELIAQSPIEPAHNCKLLVYSKNCHCWNLENSGVWGWSTVWAKLKTVESWAQAMRSEFTSPSEPLAPFGYESTKNGDENTNSNPEWQIVDTIFSSLPSLLDPEKHILFFNESKVLKARIPLKNATSRTKSGNTKQFDGEIFYLRPHDENSFVAMVYPGDRFPIWWTIIFDGVEIAVEELTYEWRLLRIRPQETCHSRPDRESTQENNSDSRFHGNDTLSFLEKYGQMPLPPYIEYSSDKEDVYQPVFARKEWSVASPTASLHFTRELLDKLTKKWFRQEKVVLHVGLGTFKNIYEENIRNFDMHVEMAEVQKDIFEKIAHYKQSWKMILAVGTTVTRTLESLPFLWPMIRGKFDWSDECGNFWDGLSPSFPWKRESSTVENDFVTDRKLSDKIEIFPIGNPLGPHQVRDDVLWVNPENNKSKVIQSFTISGDTVSFESKIFIYPGFEIQIIDELITNFHLPKSTLLMLASAFAGINEIKKIYTHAIAQKYRFFSFGDAMYLKKNQ